MTPLFLQAFSGTQQSVPVWFMRQAGRYLPEYQKLKARYPISQLFSTPELAAQITLQPIDVLDVDAAIIFADILTLPIAMGADIHFDNQRGPIIRPVNRSELNDAHDFSAVTETIRIVKSHLAKRKALIGFAGSPFTVLTYLIEGGSAINFSRTFSFMRKETEQYHHMMRLLTRNTISYLRAQQNAGIDVFQIFDTWAGILPAETFRNYVLPYVKEIFSSISLPSIYYLRQCFHLLPLMSLSGANILSVCHTADLADPQTLLWAKTGIQGNFFNGMLHASDSDIRLETQRILKASTAYDRFIFNLNHGVFPDTDPDKLKLIIQEVRSFPWRK
jgi:uroporphyrinogen decarboxylase